MWIMSVTLLKGVIRGRTIELEQEPDLPNGQRVSVQVQPEELPPKWLERFTVDPSIALGKLLILGTRLLAEDMAQLVEKGLSDDELRRLHPELTAEDVAALRQYVNVPAGLRSSFGGWAEDAAELDEFLEGVRHGRQQERPEPIP
jgi:uncharacterized protein (DUF433 family)